MNHVGEMARDELPQHVKEMWIKADTDEKHKICNEAHLGIAFWKQYIFLICAESC